MRTKEILHILLGFFILGAAAMWLNLCGLKLRVYNGFAGFFFFRLLEFFHFGPFDFESFPFDYLSLNCFKNDIYDEPV